MRYLGITLTVAVAIIGFISFRYLINKNQVNVYNQAVIINNDYNHALEIAKIENKQVILVFSATWCSWCKKMDDTLRDRNVEDYTRWYYVICKIDIDKNRKLALKYLVTGLPTSVIIRTDESIIKKEMGYKTPAEFIKWIKG